MNDIDTAMAEAVDVVVLDTQVTLVPAEGEVVAVVTTEGEVAQPEDVAV